MQARYKKSSLYRRVPRRRVRLRALLWLVIGFSVLTTVASGWAALLLNGSVASHHNFVGQLSPDADPTIINLPKGAILKEVHVPRNAVVERGQTIATLDTEAMERRIEEITAELLHDDMLRECLLSEEVPETAYFIDLPELAQTRARLARQECQTFLDQKLAVLEKLETEKTLKIEERKLIDNYIAVLSSGMRRDMLPEKREEDSRQALALALLRNKLDREIANLGFEAGKDGADWQRTRLERIKTLGDQIRIKADLKRHMQGLLKRPRLQAPESGLVVQVRRVPGKSAMPEDVDLVVLRPEDGAGYRADFEVPHHRLDQIDVGSKVKMTMLGMLDGGPVLRGTVSALNTTDQPSVRATIQLDPESVSQLDDPNIGIALRGLGTASMIHVQKTDQDTMDVLEQAFRSAFPVSGERWFWKRLVTPSVDAAVNQTAMIPG